MGFKSFRLENELEIIYRIRKDDYYLIYMLNNNLLLKKYLFNEEYYKMLERRKTDYLEYLYSLMKNSSELIVKPFDIYAKNSLITSYTYKKEIGTTICDMYPKTSLDNFLEALKVFYDKLDELSIFDLQILKPSDILYTGSIKVSGLDESEYDEKNSVQTIMNDLLFRGIFNIDSNGEITIINEDIAKLYNKLKKNEIDVIEFINEYICFIKSEYGDCKYVKHLSRGIIKSKQ